MTDRRPSPAPTAGFALFTVGQKVVTIVMILTIAIVGVLFAYLAATPTDTPTSGKAPSVAEATAQDNDGSTAATGADTPAGAYENRLDTSLQKMLDSVVGPGHSVVTTTAELDLDEVETTTRTYTSNPAVAALAEQISREAYRGAGTTTVPGGDWYDKSSTVRTNAVNQVTETRRTAPGTVKRLSVAVLLDATTAAAVEPARIQQLISTAAGVDAARGDAVAVAAMPFDTSIADQARQAQIASAAATDRVRQEKLIKTAVLALIVLLLTGLAWRTVRRASPRTASDPVVRAHLHAMQAAAEQQRLARLDTSIPQPAIGPARTMGQRKQRALEQMIEEKPDQVVALVQGWTGRNP
jgi:flagellar M-ring protein FliF